MFESIQDSRSEFDWIDSNNERRRLVHPLSYVFEGIYRCHWGIPRSDRPSIDPAGSGWRRRRDANRGVSLTDLSLDRFKN